MRLTAGICAAAAALGAWLAVAPAHAYTAHNGAAATPFASGFDADRRGIGPVGVAFDPSGRLYVGAIRNLFAFGPSGGSADSSALVNRSPYARNLSGLAFGLDGRLYAGRYKADGTGDVVELDPRDGAIVRVVAADQPCPLALAVDPLTGDLLFSNAECGRSILRISQPASDKPTVSPFVTGLFVDGLTFAPDGTLYAAHEPDFVGATISAIDGPGQADPGARRSLATVPHSDGVAVGAGNPAPFLIVNRTDGVITRVDLPSGRQTDLVRGGSRGDLIAVGSDGCLYATQSTSVLKVTNADGTCRPGDSTPPGSNPPLGGGLLPTSATVRSVVKRCATKRKIRLSVRIRGLKLRSARVYVGGRRVKTLRRRALKRRLVLRHLPAKKFTVVIRARTRGRRARVKRITYSACGRKVLRVRISRR
jgi:hypothetical protein